jgi:MFS family permease
MALIVGQLLRETLAYTYAKGEDGAENAKEELLFISEMQGSSDKVVEEITSKSLMDQKEVRAEQADIATSKAVSMVCASEGTVVIMACWFMLSFSSNVEVFMINIFVERGLTLKQAYKATLLITICAIPALFTALYLIEDLGRKQLLVMFTIIGGLFGLAFTFTSSASLTVAFVIGQAFFLSTSWAAIYAYTPEMYATVIRQTAFGMASVQNRLAGMASPLAYAFMHDSIGLKWTLCIYAGLTIITGIIAAFLPTDKTGVALDDFHAPTPRDGAGD